MYSFVNELEFALRERDKDVSIIKIDNSQLNLISFDNKKISLHFTIDKIVVRDKEKCYLKGFGYSDDEREKLIDFVLLFFNDRRTQCRDLLNSYRQEKDYSEYAFGCLLQNLNAIGYLNVFGIEILNKIYDKKINFNKNIVGLHKAVMSIINIETIEDWNFIFGNKDYKIVINRDNC